MAESEGFTTETGCRVSIIERDRDEYLLELRMDQVSSGSDLRRAEVRLSAWELHRLHSMTFRPQRVQDIPHSVLLAELQRRLTNKEILR